MLHNGSARLRGGLSLVALMSGMVLSTSAMAQAAPEGEQEQTGGIAEITVTAQRYEQKL